MDPKVVVVVMGLAAIVVRSEAFYVMVPTNKAAEELAPGTMAGGHQSRVTVYDTESKKLFDVGVAAGFELDLGGKQRFVEDQALILARGPDVMRPDCMPGNFSNCSTAAGIPLISHVIKISGAVGSMVPFDASSLENAMWSRRDPELPMATTAFVDYTPVGKDDLRLDVVELDSRFAKKLGDVFVFEGRPKVPPVLRVGPLTVTPGLQPDCQQWTGASEPCYPVVISNLNANSHSLGGGYANPPHGLIYAVADVHVKILYELLDREKMTTMPIPFEIQKGAGGSPYKCRDAAILID